jgi:hypothetical protein
MSETDLPDEDDVLRRMLNTPPKPHKADEKKAAEARKPRRPVTD